MKAGSDTDADMDLDTDGGVQVHLVLGEDGEDTDHIALDSTVEVSQAGHTHSPSGTHTVLTSMVDHVVLDFHTVVSTTVKLLKVKAKLLFDSFLRSRGQLDCTGYTLTASKIS